MTYDKILGYRYDPNVDYEVDERPCTHCQHSPTLHRDCDAIDCDNGLVSLYEEDPVNFSPNEFQICRDCRGFGSMWWCPNCYADLNQHSVGLEPN